ncbi:uncharacterized protein CDV56_105308 [Aspergillus thermomutatus]|uniref:Uncharacterized protein n=1 Tax=Aspergillus thermomutatus TaxID=41047 RepID=A0A397H3U1_ASPTH|nr:uncharacterized protein CDV56_105308 [Aspergillus thermomutatus]RHZ57677.1 hypothetical protein CDV56_105308 [Aspergillus thermomutatus]
MRCLVTLAVLAGLSVAEVTNRLGQLDSDQLPKFLSDGPLPHGLPWGQKRNPNEHPPATGVTRRYDFTVARGTASPDGFQKQVLSINGQTPGPRIEANWGDFIEVTLHNNITGPEEGTSLHWHGLLQRETPWYDGIPSVTQCPVAPGSSFTFRFRADRPGTTWYHSHYSAQYAGGLFGPLVIYGPSHVEYDVDLGPIFVGDCMKALSLRTLLDGLTLTCKTSTKTTSLSSPQVRNPLPPQKLTSAVVGNDSELWAQSSDNTLINGRGNFDCSLVTDATPCISNAGLSKFRVEQSKTYRLRLINNGAGGLIRFTIDEHILTVVSTDFVPIVPYNTTNLTLGIGQRADVLVTANGASNGAYYMRATQPPIPCARANQPNGTAIVLYDDAAEDTIPTSNAYDLGLKMFGSCAGEPLNLTVPYYAITPDPNPSTTRTIVATEPVNATGSQVFEMDGSSFHANYNEPLLLRVHQGDSSFARPWNIYDFGSNKTIRINLFNNNTSPHPMHIHGHDMYVLSHGPGEWDGSTVVNPQNPLRRDVQMLDPFSHLVIQIDANNPGVWAYHCHIAWHLSMKGYAHPLIYEPGHGWSYGPGMDWAGRTIEVVAQQDLESFMDTHIWKRIGMHSTTFRPWTRPDLTAHSVELGWRRPDGSMIPATVPLASPAADCCGGLGLYSTPNDQTKLLASLLANDGTLLAPTSVAELMKTQVEDNIYFTTEANGTNTQNSYVNGKAPRPHRQLWPNGATGCFGLSSAINNDAFPGRRAAGSANWQGMPGIHAWLDRSTGVAGLFFSQILPPGDPGVTKGCRTLEAAIYHQVRSRDE